MAPIKVCFVSTKVRALFDKGSEEFGGAELQLYLISNELAKDKRYRVIFITEDVGQPRVQRIGNITLIKSVTHGRDTLTNARTLFSALREARADMYFTSSMHLIFPVYLYCRINHKKHIHRTASQLHVDPKFKVPGLHWKLAKYALRQTDAVFTQTAQHKRILRRKRKKPIKQLPNSIKLTSTKESKNNTILWVSRHDYMKNPGMFLALARRFSKEQFIMICPYSRKDRKGWERLKRDAGRISNLTFHERIPLQRIQRYYDHARVFVNTSDFEGFPNTFVQSGIAKTPLLSLVVNPDDFLNRHDCGYCCNKDPKLLSTNLKRLLTKDEWKRKGPNIFNYTKDHHDITQNITIIKREIVRLAHET